MKMNNFEIIKCIKMQKPLWDKSTWDKTDASMREDLWDEVADKLMCSKEVLKTRWKNLRDSYRKILKKMDNMEADKSKWPYFKAMEFMRDITLNVKPRSVDITLKNSDAVSLGQSDYSTFVPSMQSDSNDPLSYNQSQQGTSEFLKEEQHTRGMKRPATDDLVTHFLEIDSETSKFTIGKQTSPKHMHDDDDYQFLLSLHPHLKLVPPNRKFPVRIKIEQIIYNEIYAQASTSSCPKTECSFSNVV